MKSKDNLFLFFILIIIMANVDTISQIFEKNLNRLISQKPKMPFTRFANFKYEGNLRNAGDEVIVSISPKIQMTDDSAKNSGNLRKTSLDTIQISDRNVKKSSLKVDKIHSYWEEYSTLEEIQTTYNIGSERMKDLIVAMDEAVEKGLIKVIDAMVLANKATNELTATAKLTVDNISTEVMRLRTAMSKKEIPMSGRKLIVSPEISSLIAMAKILNGTDDASKAAIDGWLGKFAGFEIYESNLIEGNKLYAIHEGAVNYVRQAVNAEIQKKNGSFAYLILGQVVHGGKVFDHNIERVYVMKDA